MYTNNCTSSGVILSGLLDFFGDKTAFATFILAIATFLMVVQMRNQMRHDRLVKEIEKLVAPLYLKLHTVPNYIFLKKTSLKNSSTEIKEIHSSFWNPIRQNQYLGADYLRNSLNKYFEIMEDSSDVVVEDSKYKTTETELFEAIKRRYSKLVEEIHQIEARWYWPF
jgi:hypothetical protein